MWHLLARVWPLVYHQPIAAFIYVELFGQGYACVKEAAQHLEMFCRFIAEGADVGKGDDEDMDGGFGVDVVDGENRIVPIEKFRRNF